MDLLGSADLARDQLRTGQPIGFLINYLILDMDMDSVMEALTLEQEFKFDDFGSQTEGYFPGRYNNDHWGLICTCLELFSAEKNHSMNLLGYHALNNSEVHIVFAREILKNLFRDGFQCPTTIPDKYQLNLLIETIPLDQVECLLKFRTGGNLLNRTYMLSRPDIFLYLLKQFPIKIRKFNRRIWKAFRRGSTTFQVIDKIRPIPLQEFLERMKFLFGNSPEDLSWVNLNVTPREVESFLFNSRCYSNVSWLAQNNLDFSGLLVQRMFSSNTFPSNSILFLAIITEDPIIDKILWKIRHGVYCSCGSPFCRDYRNVIKVLTFVIRGGPLSLLEKNKDLFLRFYNDPTIAINCTNPINLNWYYESIPISPGHLTHLLEINRLDIVRCYKHIFSSEKIKRVLEDSQALGNFLISYQLSQIYPGIVGTWDPVPADEECMVCKDDILGPYIVCGSNGEHHIHMNCWIESQTRFGRKCLICKSDYHPQIYNSQE